MAAKIPLNITSGIITQTHAGEGLAIPPALTTGSPASGTWAVGDLYTDSDGQLYKCTVAGTPGTWSVVGAGAGFFNRLVTIAVSLSAEEFLIVADYIIIDVGGSITIEAGATLRIDGGDRDAAPRSVTETCGMSGSDTSVWGSGTISIQLPPAANCYARAYSVINSGVGTLSLLPYHTSLINGESSQVLYEGEGVTLYTDKTNWRIT